MHIYLCVNFASQLLSRCNMSIFVYLSSINPFHIYVCVCVCICIYTYFYIHACAPVLVYTHTCAHTNVF